MNKPNHRKGISAERIKILRQEDATRRIPRLWIKGLVGEKLGSLAEERFGNGEEKEV